MDVHEISAHVLSADAWRLRGVGRARLRTMLAERRLVIAHRGWYVDAKVWDAWYVEQRHAAQAIAVWRAQRGSQSVLSHTSAAVIHGLPLYRVTPTRVHVSDARANGRVGREASVARHEVSVDGDVVCVDGLRVTSLARTVADLIGAVPVESAVSIADAALRSVAWIGDDRAYDENEDDLFRADLRACSALQPGARGSVQARWVASFADGRAERPGESVSRVHLHRLGFAKPRVQVRIPRTRGYYDVDFALDDVDVWGEFDGDGKYTDPAMRGDATALEVVIAEKRREDDIRGITRRSILRWGWPHIASPEALRRRLAEFGAYAPGPPGVIPRAFASRV